ncbi:hypothetical protein MY5147_003720, partial [Beauveria neobassiana]
MASRLQPGEASPSFAQTGAELNLDDDDSDDLFDLDDYDEEAVDLQSEVGGAEAYQLRGMRGRLSPGVPPPSRPGSARSASTTRRNARTRRRRRRSNSTAASYSL